MLVTPAVRDNSVDQAKPMMTSDSDSTDSSATSHSTWKRRAMRDSVNVNGRASATQASATATASRIEKPSTLPKNGLRNRP